MLDGRIHLLDDTLVSRLKAGEVIERPASALKELLENALDSGATSIEARIEAGGIQLLRVEDNGRGIPKEDLPLAFARHATSKIASFEDLQSALTMGFRGEALASIASVSHARIESRASGSPLAFSLSCDGGSLGSISASSRPAGTLVEARDLFFYVPARRKFLKSEITEAAHCRDAFIRAALSRPDVAMTLIKDGKTLHRLPSQSLLDRARALLGAGFADKAASVLAAQPPFSLSGLVAPIPHLPSGRESQFLFVNHRHTRDRLLTHAAKEALAQAAGLGRSMEAAFVLFLNLPPELVDANAHPAKTEVRFRDPRAAHQFALQSLREALAPFAASSSSAAPSSAALPEPEEDLFGHQPASPAAAPLLLEDVQSRWLGLLRSGWAAWDCGDQLWLCEPSSLAGVPLALSLAERATQGALSSSTFLMPARLPLSPEQLASLRAFQAPLGSLGLDFHFEPSHVDLLSAPSELDSVDWPFAIARLCESLLQGRSDALSLALALSGSLSFSADELQESSLTRCAELWMRQRRLPSEIHGAHPLPVSPRV